MNVDNSIHGVTITHTNNATWRFIQTRAEANLVSLS